MKIIRINYYFQKKGKFSKIFIMKDWYSRSSVRLSVHFRVHGWNVKKKLVSFTDSWSFVHHIELKMAAIAPRQPWSDQKSIFPKIVMLYIVKLEI